MFNNREIATAIWVTLLTFLLLTKPDVRTSMAGLFPAFFKWKILVCLTAMVLYTIMIVAGLYAIDFWQFTMIKDTALWFCFTAFLMVFRFTTSRDKEDILQKVLVDNVKLVIFLEFLVGSYVMSLPAELVFVAFVTFIAMLNAVARIDKKNASVVKLTDLLLAVIGFAILGFAVTHAIGNFRNFGTMATIRTIIFPPLMSIAFVPFIYALMVIVTYETIFIRLAAGRDKTPDVVRYAKRRIFFYCGLSLSRLRSFEKRPPFEIMQIESNNDIDRLLSSNEPRITG